MTESEDLDVPRPPLTSLTQDYMFSPSGRPTMEFLLQVRDYTERMCETTGRDLRRVLEDVVRSVFAYRQSEYKKDHRFWLYKNRSVSYSIEYRHSIGTVRVQYRYGTGTAQVWCGGLYSQVGRNILKEINTCPTMRLVYLTIVSPLLPTTSPI